MDDDSKLEANMYLGKKEVKKLKKQKRLEDILEHEASDIVKDTKEYLDEFEYDVPLTRREKKLIAKQREYELLLEQIGEEKKKNSVVSEKDEPSYKNNYVDSNIFDEQQEDIEDEQQELDEIEELLKESENENRKLTRKEKRALKKEQRLMKKYSELGLDQDDLEDIDKSESLKEQDAVQDLEKDIEIETEQEIVQTSEQNVEIDDEQSEDELEALKSTYAKLKEQKRIEKQQRMQAKLDMLEQTQDVDDEEIDFDEVYEQQAKRGFSLFGLFKRRAYNKQQMSHNMEESLAFMDEDSTETDDVQSGAQVEQVDRTLEENTNVEKQTNYQKEEDVDDEVVYNEQKANIGNGLKPKRVNKEVAEALGDEDNDHADYSHKVYQLEKVKLELEKEKLALEKYRIKNEAKLKRQIERDKRREMMRMRKEKNSLVSNHKISDDSENAGSDFADAIGGVIKEINKEKPEVKDLVTSTGIVTTPKTDLNVKKKKKHKRGVLIVKRSGSSYGE